MLVGHGRVYRYRVELLRSGIKCNMGSLQLCSYSELDGMDRHFGHVMVF